MFSFLLLVFLLLGLPTAGSSQGLSSLEYQLRATFIYNVAKFVEWPANAFPDADSPVVIGLLGTSPGSFALDYALAVKFAGKTLNGRPVVVKRWKSPEESLRSHILFVGVSEKDRLEEILKHLQTAHVLTVSEIEEFAQRGGILRFVVAGNKVQFEINNLSARNAGLRISSTLLALASLVWK